MATVLRSFAILFLSVLFSCGSFAQSAPQAPNRVDAATRIRMGGIADGVYRGLGPTDESAVMLGEIEVTVKQNMAHIRQATGLRIEEMDMDLSNKKNMQNETAIMLSTGGMGDLISPLILIKPSEGAAGLLESIINMASKGHPELVPRLEFGGKVKPAQP